MLPLASALACTAPASGTDRGGRVRAAGAVVESPLDAAPDCRGHTQSLFARPSSTPWQPEPTELYPLPPGDARRVSAEKYASRIHARASRGSTVIGYARRGALLPVVEELGSGGCSGGRWFKVDGDGHVCTGSEFAERKTGEASTRSIDTEADLPYEYAKFKRSGAPWLSRVPTRREAKALERFVERGGSRPSVVRALTNGLVFTTIVEESRVGKKVFYKSDRGWWYRGDDVDVIVPPKTRGLPLSDGVDLPIAFTIDDAVAIDCECDDAGEQCGELPLHHAFAVDHNDLDSDTVSPRGSDSATVPRSSVSIAWPTERPEQIPSGEQWLHIRLAEQTLVAYEGDQPVYATLVSTGVEGRDTPTGTHRVIRKFISTTMRGPDEKFGRYTVADVPWTMFYDGAYAIHGAYWHETFGRVRSHGCTNIPPMDARWIYHWSKPELPSGWHGSGAITDSLWVHITKA